MQIENVKKLKYSFIRVVVFKYLQILQVYNLIFYYVQALSKVKTHF